MDLDDDYDNDSDDFNKDRPNLIQNLFEDMNN